MNVGTSRSIKGGQQRGEEEAGSQAGQGQTGTRTDPGESDPAATRSQKEESNKEAGHPEIVKDTDDASSNAHAVNGTIKGELVPNRVTRRRSNIWDPPPLGVLFFDGFVTVQAEDCSHT